MGFTETIIGHIIRFIDALGYPGVALLMVLESMVAPVPSEAVMPFAGYLITSGRFTFWGVAVASTLGSLVGSYLSYAVGYYGGRPFIQQFGRFLLLNQRDFEAAERFFGKYGSAAIFVGRFIPIIRHLISLPAGLGRMNLVRFCFYTVVGATLWNMFLAWLGFHLGRHWEIIHTYSKPIDIVMVILIIAGVGFFIKSHLRRAPTAL